MSLGDESMPQTPFFDLEQVDLKELIYRVATAIALAYDSARA